jgi:hypothetical protein
MAATEVGVDVFAPARDAIAASAELAEVALLPGVRSIVPDSYSTVMKGGVRGAPVPLITVMATSDFDPANRDLVPMFAGNVRVTMCWVSEVDDAMAETVREALREQEEEGGAAGAGAGEEVDSQQPSGTTEVNDRVSDEEMQD